MGKESIRLRSRELSSGNKSLYLDIYINGNRTYEYLKLYLVPENNREAKAKNRETLRLAEAIRAKRIVELQNKVFGFQNSNEEVFFFDYFENFIEKRKQKGKENNIWLSTLAHLRIYEKNTNITFDNIDEKWIEGFKTYLEVKATSINNRTHKLKQNTKHDRYGVLCTCIKQAYKDDIISVDYMRKIDTIKKEETNRQYLSIEELERFIATNHTPVEEIAKRTFVFSCLTGLRYSDIRKLKWSEVQSDGEFTRLVFTQKKTKGQEYLDISPQAVSLMGERQKTDTLVFPKMQDNYTTNIIIRRLALEADITKQISFHTARHTFAVMMLELGTDIYTVSKLLGHRELSTTQVYAKVIDKTKRDAVMKIPKLIDVNK